MKKYKYLCKKAKKILFPGVYMDTYEQFNNDDIFKILDSINTMWEYYVACHGKYHAKFVANTVEYILKSLSYDKKTIDLGKTAGLLHDIGCIVGRWNHASMSAAIVSVWLESTPLSPEEKNMITQAIENHSRGKTYSSAIDAALYIADKIDVSKKRNLTPKPNHVRYNELSTIDNVKMYVKDKTITVDYITSDILHIDKNKSPYNSIAEAAKYLGCACRFIINGKEYSELN